MFANCENIIKINFASFNTKYVKSMKYMFHRCINLKYINNLFIFDTGNVIDMSDMFSFCNNLNNLDLSSFNTKNVNDIGFIFYGCNNLKDIYPSSHGRNEIYILVQVEKKDINHKIYFLDNNVDKKNLKELNVLNTELYIDNKKHKYMKYFIP